MVNISATGAGAKKEICLKRHSICIANKNERPNIGDTINAYCDCAKRETTWVIQIETYKGSPNAEYLPWACLNCGKKRAIGVWQRLGLIRQLYTLRPY